MRLRNQQGFALLPFSLVMAAVLASIFFYASNKSDRLIARYRSAQAQTDAVDIAAKLAQRIRWAYDIAEADKMPSNPRLCTLTYHGSVVNVGTYQLCVIGGRICVEHPRRSSVSVCVVPNSTLTAKLSAPSNAQPISTSDSSKRSLVTFAQLSEVLISQALAAPGSPPEPNAAEVSVNLGVLAPTQCHGGCAVTCSANASCLTIRFCPLTGACQPNEEVWQTIGLIR